LSSSPLCAPIIITATHRPISTHSFLLPISCHKTCVRRRRSAPRVVRSSQVLLCCVVLPCVYACLPSLPPLPAIPYLASWSGTRGRSLGPAASPGPLAAPGASTGTGSLNALATALASTSASVSASAALPSRAARPHSGAPRSPRSSRAGLPGGDSGVPRSLSPRSPRPSSSGGVPQQGVTCTCNPAGVTWTGGMQIT
jgi:hypothetical protein